MNDLIISCIYACKSHKKQKKHTHTFCIIASANFFSTNCHSAANKEEVKNTNHGAHTYKQNATSRCGHQEELGSCSPCWTKPRRSSSLEQNRRCCLPFLQPRKPLESVPFFSFLSKQTSSSNLRQIFPRNPKTHHQSQRGRHTERTTPLP
jgi:hypothetical protein